MVRVFRVVIITLVLSIVGVVGVTAFQYNQAVTAQSVDLSSAVLDETVVRSGDLFVTVSATGSVMPARQIGLAFELSAPVTEILVTEGQVVEQGDILARLDSADLELNLMDAQIALESQRVSYNALTAPAREVDIAVAQAAVNAAQASASASFQGSTESEQEIARLQTELARNRLWQAQLDGRNPESALTQLDYDVLISDQNYAGVQNEGPDIGGLSSANAQIVSARVQLDQLLNGPDALELARAEADIGRALLSVEQAEVNLSRAVLVAPFSGVVSRVNLKVGEAPPPGAALEIIDNSSYYVDMAVDETDIVQLQTGQTAELTLDALPGVDVTAVVTRVLPTPVRVGQLVTYTARITLNPTDEPVRVGMSATAAILINELSDVLVLPNRFVRIDRATQQAYVTVSRDDGQFEDLPVTLGVRNETESQIVSGLEAGQRVVLLPRETFNPIG